MLIVENLTKAYGDFLAVKGVSFSVDKGEILGLIGENGAGKSTTIKILVGLLKPTSGTVEYDGLNLFENLDTIRRRIGYVPEIDTLYEDMKAREYLEFFASLYNANIKRIDYVMDILKIPDKTIAEFSKGMKRKLSIARSLLHNPDYLIYDEPIGGLDPTTALFIADFMKSLKDKAILFSAHNLYYVEMICSKVAIMKSGKILYYGDVEELKGMNTYKLYYKEDQTVKEFKTNDVEELNEFIREIALKAKIVRIYMDVRRLEDVYFELMKR